MKRLFFILALAVSSSFNKFKASRDLAIKPMAMLGIDYSQKDLVESIITATGQRANLIAIVCDSMLKNLSNDRRILNAEDVATALHHWAVQDALSVWTQVIRNDEQASRLMRIIVYATVEANEFTLTDVMNVLNEHEYVYTTEQLQKVLRRLELAYIIRRDKDRYHYCIPLFREMLLEQEVDMLLEQELKF